MEAVINLSVRMFFSLRRCLPAGMSSDELTGKSGATYPAKTATKLETMRSRSTFLGRGSLLLRMSLLWSHVAPDTNTGPFFSTLTLLGIVSISVLPRLASSSPRMLFLLMPAEACGDAIAAQMMAGMPRPTEQRWYAFPSRGPPFEDDVEELDMLVFLRCFLSSRVGSVSVGNAMISRLPSSCWSGVLCCRCPLSAFMY